MGINFRTILSNLDMGNAVNITVYLTMSLIILVVLMGIIFDKQNQKNTFIKWFSSSLTANIVMLVAEAALCFFDGNVEAILLTKICAAISYCAGYLMAGFFAFCLVEFICETVKEIPHFYAHIIFTFLSIVSVWVIVGIFAEIIVFFDGTGTMQYSDHYKLVNMTNALIFSSEILFVFGHKKLLGNKTYLLSLFGLLSIASTPFTLFWDTVPLYVAVSVSLLIMNNIFRNEISNRLLENEKKISEIRVVNLVNQMQPHFIFNTLNTIKHLCKTDAELARKTIDSYSVLLRGIIESASSERFVTIERELEIAEHYMFIEKQRFGDIACLDIDLQEKDFNLPMLTIQPLVENAYKHGIRMKDNKGTISVSTYSDAENYYVKISDDGVGFNVEAVDISDEKHLGLKNVSDRVQLMSKGKVEIESIPGIGTTVVITIPKKVRKTVS